MRGRREIIYIYIYECMYALEGGGLAGVGLGEEVYIVLVHTYIAIL